MLKNANATNFAYFKPENGDFSPFLVNFMI